jgi:hypothetical protein
MSDNPTKLDERDEIEMLLPWYVIGRLDAADKARVEGWLARDTKLEQQLKLIEDERRGAVMANESVVPPATLSVRQSIGEISNQNSRMPEQLSKLVMQIQRFFEAPQPHTVRWATVAAAAVLILQGGWIAFLMSAREPVGYMPASGGTEQVSSGTFVLMRFADTATAKDISSALSTLSITIADGPRAGGLFRVRIGEAGMTDQKRDEMIAELKRNSGLIALVTPTR